MFMWVKMEMYGITLQSELFHSREECLEDLRKYLLEKASVYAIEEEVLPQIPGFDLSEINDYLWENEVSFSILEIQFQTAHQEMRARFDEQFEDARRRGEYLNKAEPRTERAWFDTASYEVCIVLKSGAWACFPQRLLEGISDAPLELVKKVEVTPQGTGLHWEELDVDLSVSGLMNQIFGSKAWMESLTIG